MHYNGVFAATRDVKFVLSHAGGTVPYLAQRFAVIDEMAVIPDEGAIRGSAADTFRRLYWDTALAWSDPTLHTLRAVAGMDHVVYGSDYPYLRRDIAIRGHAELESSPELSDLERAAVLHGAAVSLLPRLANHPGLAVGAATGGR
jgi:aminocarboxymuconate-semialdehyde decarboxylase